MRLFAKETNNNKKGTQNTKKKCKCGEGEKQKQILPLQCKPIQPFPTPIYLTTIFQTKKIQHSFFKEIFIHHPPIPRYTLDRS